jgi:hypothetical protein
VVGDTGIEPVTSSVSGKRATAAPIALNRKNPEWNFVNLFVEESGRRDSNSRHPPWQGGALPAELRPHMKSLPAGPVVLHQASCLALVGDTGIEPVTSSVSGKRATAAPIAPCYPAETGNQGFHRGGYGIRTRVYGFAGRCLASRPTHRVGSIPKNLCRDSVLRADDEIRTRDIHLGKVVLYQLSYVRNVKCDSLPHLAFPRVPTSKNSIGGSANLQIGRSGVGLEGPTSLNSRDIF